LSMSYHMIKAVTAPHFQEHTFK